MFTEIFLQSKNQDCLEQVLSFLTCKELANAGRTSKKLQHTIFETSEEEGNINLIWQGAEKVMTNPEDKREPFMETAQRIGSNAREHSRLYITASKAAKALEVSGEIAGDRVMVDELLANLLNVRGYDAESVAEKKAIGSKETRTVEDGVLEMDITGEPDDEDQISRNKELNQERMSRLGEEIEKLKAIKPPDKPDHHAVFVRVTRESSGEVVSQGFCDIGQKFPWYFGLELAKDFMPFGFDQGLQIFLDFESLKQSEEIQSFQKTYSESSGLDVPTNFGLNMTAVTIDKRNYGVQCLLQQAQGQETPCAAQYPGLGFFQGLGARTYQCPLQPRWSPDIMQLGPSICKDRYILSYSLSLNIAQLKTGGWIVVPTLDVDIVPDRTILQLAMRRWIESRLRASGAVIMN